MYVCMYIRVYSCIFVYICACVCVKIFLCVCIWVYICVYICVYVHMDICTHIYIYMYMLDDGIAAALPCIIYTDQRMHARKMFRLLETMGRCLIQCCGGNRITIYIQHIYIYMYVYIYIHVYIYTAGQGWLRFILRSIFDSIISRRGISVISSK